MLDLSDITALSCTSKKANEIISSNKTTWLHIISQVKSENRKITNELKEKIELLENKDKRFAFLKNPNTTKEMNQLIEDYVCKNKFLGSSIAKIVKDTKSFIYTGEMNNESPVKEKPKETSGGFFSALSNVFGYNTTPEQKETEDESDKIFTEIIASEKSISAEAINGLLTTTSKRLAFTNQEKVNKWVMTMQKCLSQLYKGVLMFYGEAKDVEKVKDFLTKRYEQVRSKLKEVKETNEKLINQCKENREVVLKNKE